MPDYVFNCAIDRETCKKREMKKLEIEELGEDQIAEIEQKMD
jgi:hypothetical protein